MRPSTTQQPMTLPMTLPMTATPTKKPHIKLGFSDFWENFKDDDNYFTQVLSQKYDLEICDDPDYLIYSCFGKQYRKFKKVRICYLGENRRPDFSVCDYAMTFDYLDQQQHLRLPYYVCVQKPETLIRSPEFDAQQELAKKSKFCNFVYSNPDCKKRNDFFRKLSKYKPVDSGGRYLNNIGGPVPHKLTFLKDYKFTIAFENSSYPGYTTEKIVEPMSVSSLPIYWGNKRVSEEFNSQSFLNYEDFGSDEALIEKIIELDQNDQKYLEITSEPVFHENKPNRFYSPEHLQDYFEFIINRSIQPVAQSLKSYFISQGRRFGRNFTRIARKAEQKLRSA